MHAAESIEARALHQLDAIAERVENMRAAEVADGGVGARGQAGALTRGDDIVEVVDSQSGMRAASGVKIGVGFNTEMQIHRSSHKPDAIASSHGGGFRLFGETKDTNVKRARGFLAAGGNRDLYVIEIKDWHRVLPREADRCPPWRNTEVAA